MEKNSRIFVAGHRSLVGSALLRALKAAGYTNIPVQTHVELDLCNSAPRKLPDVSGLQRLGWKVSTPLCEGVAAAYQDFLMPKVEK